MEANFVVRLKKGTSIYRGKLPFNCFNCGKVGHYASKFPSFKSFKKTYYVKKDSGTSNDEELDYLDNESDEFFFMDLNVGTNSTDP